MAEGTRFELVRGRPLHAFQLLVRVFSWVRQRVDLRRTAWTAFRRPLQNGGECNCDCNCAERGAGQNFHAAAGRQSGAGRALDHTSEGVLAARAPSGH